MARDWPDGWSLLPLADCMSAIIDYRGKSPRKVFTGIPLITAKVVKGGRIEKPEEFIAPDDYDSWMRRGLPKKGDVVMTTEAPLGEIAQLDGAKIALAQRLITLRAKSDLLDNTYLKFLMQSAFVQEQLRARATGTTVLGIRQSELRKVVLVVPPLAEQQSIARILGTLDDKIELNRRMSETLEAMARAIFKSWFVDFDPVRAKMDGRQPAGMDAETAALFPAQLEDTAIGKTPTGWPLAYVRDRVDIVKGRSYASRELADSETALVTLKSIKRGGGYRPDGLKPFIGSFKPDQRILPGELIVAFTDVTQAAEVIGKPAIVLQDDRFSSLVASLDLAIVRPRKGHVTVPFMYFLLMSDDFQNHAYSRCTGTTVLHLSKDALPSYCFAQPPGALVERFTTVAAPMLSRCETSFQESKLLGRVRDTLLPKLLSGELRVPEAEKVVEELV